MVLTHYIARLVYLRMLERNLIITVFEAESNNRRRGGWSLKDGRLADLFLRHL